VTSPEPSLRQPYPEDGSSTKKRRKHRSEKDKEKDGERKHRSRSSKHAGEGEGDINGDGERRHRKHRTKGEPVFDNGLAPVRKHRSHRDKDKDKDSERRHRKHRRHDERPILEVTPADVPAQLDANGSVPMDTFLTVSTTTNGGGSSSTQFEIVSGEGDEGAGLPDERDYEREREHRHKGSKRERHHRHESQNEVEERPREPRYYPLAEHLCNAELLAPLVAYLTFPDFYALWNSTRLVSKIMEDTPALRELALEKFLGSVGYRRWTFSERREPVSLSLQVFDVYSTRDK
jgi:hypothetical protein